MKVPQGVPALMPSIRAYEDNPGRPGLPPSARRRAHRDFLVAFPLDGTSVNPA